MQGLSSRAGTIVDEAVTRPAGEDGGHIVQPSLGRYADAEQPRHQDQQVVAHVVGKWAESLRHTTAVELAT